MDSRVLEPGEAHERIAAWQGRVDRLAADTKAMSDRLQELRLTVADANGIVEVTVDSSGALIDLSLSSRIRRVPHEEVARTVMETLQEAKRRLAEQSAQIIESTLGDSAAGRAIAERVRERLTPPDENERR